MNEIWKPVTGYEGLYEVSNLGRVKFLRPHSRSKGECIMRTFIGADGHHNVKLCKDKKRKHFKLHRVVTTTFLGENVLEVNHKDGNPSNNAVDNLEYVHHRENQNHWTKGQFLKGVYQERNDIFYRAKITIKNKRVLLGKFITEIEAHHAYLAAVKNIGEAKYAGM